MASWREWSASERRSRTRSASSVARRAKRREDGTGTTAAASRDDKDAELMKESAPHFSSASMANINLKGWSAAAMVKTTVYRGDDDGRDDDGRDDDGRDDDERRAADVDASAAASAAAKAAFTASFEEMVPGARDGAAPRLTSPGTELDRGAGAVPESPRVREEPDAGTSAPPPATPRAPEAWDWDASVAENLGLDAVVVAAASPVVAAGGWSALSPVSLPPRTDPFAFAFAFEPEPESSFVEAGALGARARATVASDEAVRATTLHQTYRAERQAREDLRDRTRELARVIKEKESAPPRSPLRGQLEAEYRKVLGECEDLEESLRQMSGRESPGRAAADAEVAARAAEAGSRADEWSRRVGRMREDASGE